MQAAGTRFGGGGGGMPLGTNAPGTVPAFGSLMGTLSTSTAGTSSATSFSAAPQAAPAKPAMTGGFGSLMGKGSSSSFGSAPSTTGAGFGSALGASAPAKLHGVSDAAKGPGKPSVGLGFGALPGTSAGAFGGAKTGAGLSSSSGISSKPLGGPTAAGLGFGSATGASLGSVSSGNTLSLLTDRAQATASSVSIGSSGKEDRFDEGRHGPLAADDVGNFVAKLTNLNPPKSSLTQGAQKVQQEEWLKWLRDLEFGKQGLWRVRYVLDAAAQMRVKHPLNTLPHNHLVAMWLLATRTGRLLRKGRITGSQGTVLLLFVSGCAGNMQI